MQVMHLPYPVCAAFADAAPELLFGAAPSLASDIYSFGVLIHEVHLSHSALSTWIWQMGISFVRCRFRLLFEESIKPGNTHSRALVLFTVCSAEGPQRLQLQTQGHCNE